MVNYSILVTNATTEMTYNDRDAIRYSDINYFKYLIDIFYN